MFIAPEETFYETVEQTFQSPMKYILHTVGYEVPEEFYKWSFSVSASNSILSDVP